VWSVAYSPNGKTVASGQEYNSVQLWDAKQWYAIRTLVGHTDQVHTLSFSPDSHTLASGGWDDTIRFWDLLLVNR
jgi:WD40 repeat protein